MSTRNSAWTATSWLRASAWPGVPGPTPPPSSCSRKRAPRCAAPKPWASPPPPLPSVPNPSADLAQRCPVPLGVVDVFETRHPDHRHVRPALQDSGRHAQCQRARGDHDVVGYDGIGADRRAGADDSPMEDDAAEAGQRLVLEGAPFEVRQVADDATVADDRRETRPGVDDRAVLNGRARSPGDGGVVT